MIQPVKHVVRFEGGNALPAFRAAALLARLQGVCERLAGIEARHAYWVWSEAPLDRAARDRLAALLDEGEPPLPAGHGDAAALVVAPRLGTVSPWASKATDIAHNCGLTLKRVERVTEFRLTHKTGLLGGSKPLSADERTACAALLHDRMTESVQIGRASCRERVCCKV